MIINIIIIYICLNIARAKHSATLSETENKMALISLVQSESVRVTSTNIQ